MICLRKMNINDISQFRKWLYTPHVSKWYQDPLDWIDEIEKQDTEFKWIYHFIVEHKGNPIGFCQYYACTDSKELWAGYTALGGSYSIDYLIGEREYLRKGFGQQIIKGLIEKIKLHHDVKRIVVSPEQENKASCNLLLSCGFVLDTDKNIYFKIL